MKNLKQMTNISYITQKLKNITLPHKRNQYSQSVNHCITPYSIFMSLIFVKAYSYIDYHILS